MRIHTHTSTLTHTQTNCTNLDCLLVRLIIKCQDPIWSLPLHWYTLTHLHIGQTIPKLSLLLLLFLVNKYASYVPKLFVGSSKSKISGSSMSAAASNSLACCPPLNDFMIRSYGAINCTSVSTLAIRESIPRRERMEN